MLIFCYGILQLSMSATSSIGWTAKTRNRLTSEDLDASPPSATFEDLAASAIRRSILRLRYSTIVLSVEYFWAMNLATALTRWGSGERMTALKLVLILK